MTGEMIHTSHLPLSMAALHKTPWHSGENGHMKFSGKKTQTRGVCVPFCQADFILR